MSRGYRKRRQRLAAHDAGHDRHSKGRSVEAKLARLQREHDAPARNPVRRRTRRARLEARAAELRALLPELRDDEGWV